MVDLVDFKVRDVYSGTLVRSRTGEDLKEWLLSKYVTLTSEQRRCIDGLCAALEEGTETRWWAAACGLTIEPAKKKRSKKK